MVNTIGQKISIERLSRKWTQAALADELGIAQSLLSDIENDKVSPKWDLITNIADKFEIPVNNLLPTASMNNPNFNDNSVGIVNNYGQANIDTRIYEELLKAKDEIIILQKQLLLGLDKKVS